MSTSHRRRFDTLPPETSRLVGRDQDVLRIRELMASHSCVTLTGPGGVGKTRLALHLATAARSSFRDGVLWVELADLWEPSLLAQTVVDVVGVREASTRTALQVLTDYLNDTQLLLVLDNCEHMLTASAELVDSLRQTVPAIRVLATSRALLGVRGEVSYPVSPLAIPEDDQPVNPEDLSAAPALALLADRAAAVIDDFEITQETLADATRLCRRLDGIPLAIELAVGRLRFLSLRELADHLDDRFRLLTGGASTLPARQQTLLAAVEYSFHRCSAYERLLWMRASVFAGSFDLEAARSVCHDEELPATKVLDALTGLADKSIVLRERRTGLIRFRMLETLREYGAVRLRSADHDYDVRKAAHREGVAELLTTAATDWFGPRQLAWMARMRLEQPNIRAALEYCLNAPGEERVGLRMAGGAWFLWVTANLAEGRVWLDRLLAASPEPTPERALALCTDAFIMCLQGDPDRAEERASECLNTTSPLADGVVVGYATEMLALAAFLQGDQARSEILFDEASTGYDDAGGPADLRALLRVQYAALLMLHGEVDRAARLFDEVCSMCRKHDEQWVLSYGLWGRAFVHFARGELEVAEQLARETLGIKRSFGDTLGLSLALDALAWILAAKGEARKAARLLGTASQAWGSFGAQLFGSKAFLAERERCIETTRRTLGAGTYEAEFAAGASLSLDQVVASLVESQTAAGPITATGDPRLTEDEWHVAALIAQRLTDQVIASELVLSPHSVRVHIETILAKLGLEDRTEIASIVPGPRPG